ncbi:surfeit locus protein 5 subunit 22 of mediator complex-domain-containing protein [Syncephalastrum racemosum]|uniref:Surfeit locus protein 5 subunit 22 of mediator complex-domain-containing protein n=1 Tax=Syncephalastrum racemosum TaxID=13706 RepID=A0A1X2HDW0_SYNRA|nr:surfeit locus protein 5 subunit 22 of mediator complex-domain-containing protein [Syncephalastrum racemosum]
MILPCMNKYFRGFGTAEQFILSPKHFAFFPARMEDQYNKRIDDDIAKLVDCFADIIRVGENKDKDKFRVAEEGYQIESQSAQIVRSTESLLSLITELKQHLLLNDTQTLSRLTNNRIQRLDTQKKAIRDTILDMREELTSTISDLETVYFRSLTADY